MTILFLSRLFYPHVGGVEKHVYKISKKLQEKGHKIIVVAEKHEKSLKNREIYEGIEIYRIPIRTNGWFKKFEIWFWFLKNQDLIKKADVIHCHDVFFWYLPFRFLYPSKKVFTTFHGYEGNNIPTKKAIFMHKIAEKLSHGNICVGDFLRKWYGTKPNYVAYGAVEIPSINTNTANRYQLTNKRIKTKFNLVKILFLGRLEEETGIMEYLKALKILTDKKYQIKLIVLGDGSQRKEAEEFSHQNNLNIEFKGFVQNIDRYLKDTDFVFTSRYLGILESFAQKKRIFALYNNNIKKDYLRLTPFSKYIFSCSSSEELVGKFENTFKNKNIISTKINNSFIWVNNQTWDKISNIYLKLWNNIAN